MRHQIGLAMIWLGGKLMRWASRFVRYSDVVLPLLPPAREDPEYVLPWNED